MLSLELSFYFHWMMYDMNPTTAIFSYSVLENHLIGVKE